MQAQDSDDEKIEIYLEVIIFIPESYLILLVLSDPIMSNDFSVAVHWKNSKAVIR